MIVTIPKYATIKDLKIVGIYFLLKKKKIVYIGQTVNAVPRINSHVNNIDFDQVRIIQCRKKVLKKYEKRWIIRFRPKHNTTYLFKFLGHWRTSRVKVAYNLINKAA